jgi:hypothetical protein
MRACPSAPGWPVSRRDKACDRKHPEHDPERAGGPVNDLSRAAWNVELPEFKHGGIGDEPTHKPRSRAAGVREGE